MHRSLRLTAATLLAAAAGTASAGAILIDDFSVDQAQLSDNTVNGVAVTSTVNGISASAQSRKISVNLLAASAPVSSTAEVGFGILDITNGGGEDSEVILDWVLNPIAIPAGASNVSFAALVVLSDGNPTDVEFLFNGATLLTSAIAPNTSNQTVTFGLNAAQLANGGTLTMKINGSAGWDLSMDTFGISYTDPSNNVPEPSVLALVGLALAGAGLASRRRKA